MKGRKQAYIGACLVGLGVSMVTSPAAAADPPQLDWEQVVVGLDRFARTGSLTAKPKTNANAEKPKVAPAPGPQNAPPVDDPNPQNFGNAWFGVAPKMTLVARDWATSSKLFGDRLSAVDAVRLSASTRMVIGRARLNNARFTPFLQVGLGQWRVDRNFLPFTPHMEEFASQVGGGFELRVSRKWQIAAELSSTIMFRDGRYADSGLPEASLWSSSLTSRIEF